MPKPPRRRFDALFRDPREPWMDWGQRRHKLDAKGLPTLSGTQAVGPPAQRPARVARWRTQRRLRPSPASIARVLGIKRDESLVLRASRHPLSVLQAVATDRWRWAGLCVAGLLCWAAPARSPLQLALAAAALWLATTVAGHTKQALAAGDSLPIEVAAHGHGVIVRDDAGRAEALPWSLVHSARQAADAVNLRLAPVQRSTPRSLHLPASEGALRLLEAVRLAQSWQAEGVILPDLHEDVPDAALSPARMDGGAADGERGLSVAEEPAAR